MIKKMDRDEFYAKITKEFTRDELAKINPEIYLNPEHTVYFRHYHLGEYDWCWTYLIEHRDLLKTRLL